MRGMVLHTTLMTGILATVLMPLAAGGVVLQNYTNDVSAVLDLDHDLASYFHTRDLLKRKMELLADCGIGRLYIIAPPPGEPDYSIRVVPDDSVNFLRISREELADDPLKLAITYAKQAGLEVFVQFKPYEGGGAYSVPQGFVPPCGRNWIDSISGRAVGLDPFILSNSTMRVKRKATDEHLALPVDKIEMVFAPASNPSQYPASNFIIYTSTDNGSYTAAYSQNAGSITVSDTADSRQIFAANGELAYSGQCRVITLSGFSMTSPYFAVKFTGDEEAFRTIPYSDSCFIAYSGTQALPTTVTPTLRDGLLTGLYGFTNNGFEFEEIGPYYWDYGWETETLFGFARGKEEYQRGALCEAYPEVRAHWMDQIQHYIDLGCDGVDVRFLCHSAGITDFINYGFNAPLVDAYLTKYGVDITTQPLDPIKMMRLRGDFFMQFVEDAASLLHQNNLVLQLHFNDYLESPTLDPTFPGAGFWAAPKVVPTWSNMVALADEITIKDYNWAAYDPQKSSSIKDAAYAAGKPLWITCYMQQGHDLNSQFLQDAEQDQRVTGLQLYEVKYSAGTVNDGMVEFTDDGTVRLVPGSPIYSELVNPPPPSLTGVARIHAQADTYIDSANASANYGSATSLPISNDGAGNEKWGFVKWDPSLIPEDAEITNVVFEILQTDYTVGDGLDVYAINSGDWDEFTLTWNSWTNRPTSKTFLGIMSPIVRFDTGACSFSNANLLERVRQWHNESKPNHGLLLKWHHDTQWGQDTFIPREHPNGDPMLIVEYSTTSAADHVVTNDVTADTEIDQHVNYMNANLNGATAMQVETRSAAYTNPVESPQSWCLLKWDLSGFDPNTVVGRATLRIIQVDGAVGSVEVYGIDSGDWDVDTVTWNNWVGTETLHLLGTMHNASYPDGVTTFSSSKLAKRVQDWIDGDQANLGLLLKWSGCVGYGDNYATSEHTSLDPPQLIIGTNAPPPSTGFLFMIR